MSLELIQKIQAQGRKWATELQIARNLTEKENNMAESQRGKAKLKAKAKKSPSKPIKNVRKVKERKMSGY